jgi:hypothetical protein
MPSCQTHPDTSFDTKTRIEREIIAVIYSECRWAGTPDGLGIRWEGTGVQEEEYEECGASWGFGEGEVCIVYEGL